VSVEQGRVERGVAEADAVVGEADRVERLAEHRQGLGGAGRPGNADQLDPGLEHLAVLPALGPHRAVGVRDVAEAQRRIRARVAGRDDARDRDRHVRAQHEHVALLVEQLVGGVGRRGVAAREHLLVLERGRVDLSVAVRVEDAAELLRHRVELAHLVRQDVARAARRGVDRHAEGRYRYVTSRSMRAPSPRSRSSIRS
jgi:hypothetical protein